MACIIREINVTWAIIGIGRERTKTPAAAIRDPNSFPIPSLNWYFQTFSLHICSEYFTWCGVDVTVAHSGHGDDAVVDGGGDWAEARVIAQLYEVAEAAEDEACDSHEEHQQGQLLRRQRDTWHQSDDNHDTL